VHCCATTVPTTTPTATAANSILVGFEANLSSKEKEKRKKERKEVKEQENNCRRMGSTAYKQYIMPHFFGGQFRDADGNFNMTVDQYLLLLSQ
jgi:hypothetical protein